MKSFLNKKISKIEREILERAFGYVNDYYAWDDEYEDEDEFLEKIQPKIENLAKKLGIDI